MSTLKTTHRANQDKTQKVAALLPHWNNAVQSFLSSWHHTHQQHGTIPRKLAPTKTSDLTFTTKLSARQIKSSYNQAYAAYQSYLSQLQNELRSKLNKYKHPHLDLTILNRINATQNWYTHNLTLPWKLDPTTGEAKVPTPKDYKEEKLTPGYLTSIPVPKEYQRYLQTLIKHARTTLPNIHHNRTMLMDNTIAERQDSNTEEFGWWIRVSTLEKGKVVYIPINHNPYLTERAHNAKKIAGVTQVHVAEDSQVTYSFVLNEHDHGPARGDQIVAIDANFSDNLFSFSDGNLWGEKLVRWLKEMDDKIIAHQKKLQKAGIPLKKDKTYRRLIKRVEDFTKNEINRLINRAIAMKDVEILLVEQLDFRSSGLSRRMNRLLTRMGRGAVRAKLERLPVSHGVSVEKCNPAYSSQQCAECKYTDRLNRDTKRKDRMFVCRCCGNKVHADVNAPRVLEDRRSVFGSSPLVSVKRDRVRELLNELHRATCSKDHAMSNVGVTGSKKRGSQASPYSSDSVLDLNHQDSSSIL